MDAREARRAAEKAARDLINARATVIGDLGVAASAHTDSATAVTRAHERAAALIEEARQQGAQLVEAAEQDAAAAAATYADAITAALAAGWTREELTSLQFAPPTARSPRRKQRSAGKTTATADSTTAPLTETNSRAAAEPAAASSDAA